MSANIKSQMTVLQTKINHRLKVFFDSEIKKAALLDKTFEEATRMVADFTLRGGKRIRSILMYYGYLATGQKRTRAILDASLAMELAHSFLLIQDDIIDNDKTRRGDLTLHKQYEKLFWNLGIADKEKMGQSMATLCANIAYTLANKIICESDFPGKIKISATRQLQLIINHTTAGQIMDIVGSTKKNISVNDVLNIYKNKTAKYTIEGPLLIGTILGEGGEKLKNIISQYAIFLGVAFQIKDDILDLFASHQEIGKDIGSDIREGRQTLIIVKTLKSCTKKQKNKILSFFGKKNIKSSDIKYFKKVAEETKSLDYCYKIAYNLSYQAKEIIVNSNISGVTRDFLLGTADYIVDTKRCK